MTTDLRDNPAGTGTGERDTGGRFVTGNRIGRTGGRPAKIDLRAVVERKAAESGTDLEAELWAILLGQIALAKTGNVRAATFVFEMLTEQDAKRLELLTPETEPMSRRDVALRITSIISTAVHGDAPLAAELVGIALRGVGDAQLDELADAILTKLRAMPVADHARRTTNGATS